MFLPRWKPATDGWRASDTRKGRWSFLLPISRPGLRDKRYVWRSWAARAIFIRLSKTPPAKYQMLPTSRSISKRTAPIEAGRRATPSMPPRFASASTRQVISPSSGTDSINPNIGLPQQSVGGRAHQRSLNLGGFDVARPSSWQGTVRHEFLHALSFHHEHQNMRGPCEAAFRWEDDPGYQPTRDARGAYVTDAAGLRPGIYTYLSGYPNGWPKSKVDFNLRTISDSRALVAGPFDPASVMLYRFPALFYRTQPSPCAPAGDGQQLSDGDKRGLKLLYPKAAAALSAIVERREVLLKTIEQPRAEAPTRASSQPRGHFPISRAMRPAGSAAV